MTGVRRFCKFLAGGAMLIGTIGCADLRYHNTATLFDHPPPAGEPSLADLWFKTSYVYPVRDYLTLTWAGRALFGDEAWNVTADGGVADGPFFVNRDIVAVAADDLRQGPGAAPAPLGPWHLIKPKDQGATPGFVGQDARGRTFLVKLDRPDYPELGTGAEMIGSRLTWLLGYRVPDIHLVTIEGTGDTRYDGRRATASPIVPGRIIGHWKFDHYRMRREVRAQRLVAEWLNDTDRTDNNTLAVEQDGRTRCYLVDFNSCLGSWNGRPKAPWQGWRHAWDVEYQLLGLATLGLLPRIPAESRISSRAVGAIEPEEGTGHPWKPQNPNTAFDRLTRADAEWISRRMAMVSTEQLRAIVAAARYGRAEDAELAWRVLVRRREQIIARWR